MKKLPKIQKICEICGRMFEVKPYRSKTAKQCSFTCHQKAASKISAVMRGNLLRYSGSTNGYVKFNSRHMHRVIAEQMLGRPLRSGEIVHHRDGNKQNNNPENLEILFQSQHVKRHIKMMLAQRKIKVGF